MVLQKRVQSREKHCEKNETESGPFDDDFVSFSREYPHESLYLGEVDGKTGEIGDDHDGEILIDGT